MRSFFSLIILLLSAALAAAQTDGVTLNGVVSGADGAEVFGISVRLSELRTGRTYETKADTAGSFGFQSVRPGKYVLTAESDTDRSSVPILIEIGSAPVTGVELKLGPIRAISEVVDVRISAGTSQPVSEVAKTIDVIGREEIESRDDVSLVDTLRSVPGFRVQQLGGFGRTASIKTRGLRNQDTAVLIDGMRFRDPASITGDASAFLSDVSLIGADRIEVLRGSGSSIYGTNAIGGVIDIRSEEPASGVHGDLDGGFGGLGYKNARGRFAYGGDRFGISVSAARTVFSKGIDGEDDAKNTGFQVRGNYRFGSDTTVSGRILTSNALVMLNASPDTLGTIGTGIIDATPGVNFIPDENDPDNSQASDFYLGRLSVSHSFGPKLLFEAVYQGLTTKRTNENGELGPGFQPFGGPETSIFEGRTDTFNAGLSWTPSVSRLFRFGYEFESEDYRNEGLGPFDSSDFFTDAGQKSSTFYLQHLAGLLGGRLQVAGGVRFQFFDVGATSFSVQNAPYQGLQIDNPPSAVTVDGSVSYYFRSSGTKIRAHGGNGYRVPSLYERLGTFYSSFSQDFTALGDPDLKPERSVAFDAGIEQDLWNSKAKISATYFYTRLTDTIGYGFPVPDIGSTTRPFGGYRNEKGGISRGVEISVSARPTASTYVFSSYTFTNSDQRTPQVAGSGIIETLGIPSDQFTLVATQRLLRRLTVSFDLLVSGSYLAPIFSNQTFSTVLYRFEGNRRGDLSAAYELPVFDERARVVFRGTIQNVFDNGYFENGFRTEGRVARAGLGIEF